MSSDKFETAASADNVLIMADFVSELRPTAEQLAASKARHFGFLNRPPQVSAITPPLVENLYPDNVADLANNREPSMINPTDPDNVS